MKANNQLYVRNRHEDWILRWGCERHGPAGAVSVLPKLRDCLETEEQQYGRSGWSSKKGVHSMDWNARGKGRFGEKASATPTRAEDCANKSESRRMSGSRSDRRSERQPALPAGMQPVQRQRDTTHDNWVCMRGGLARTWGQRGRGGAVLAPCDG